MELVDASGGRDKSCDGSSSFDGGGGDGVHVRLCLPWRLTGDCLRASRLVWDNRPERGSAPVCP
jgi:hypothetical protein